MAETETHLEGVEEATRNAETTADQLEQRSEKVGEGIEHAKKRWDDAQKSDDVPSASGDWEDSEAEDSTGEDPSGFDDPETVDEDDDDDLDDE